MIGRGISWWYPQIEEFTPKTVKCDIANTELIEKSLSKFGGKAFVRLELRSLKEYGGIVKSSREIEELLSISTSILPAERVKTVFLRKVVEIETEFRLFVEDDELIAISINEDFGSFLESPETIGKRLVEYFEEIPQLSIRDYTIDVAIQKNSEPIVIEINSSHKELADSGLFETSELVPYDEYIPFRFYSDGFRVEEILLSKSRN